MSQNKHSNNPHSKTGTGSLGVTVDTIRSAIREVCKKFAVYRELGLLGFATLLLGPVRNGTISLPTTVEELEKVAKCFYQSSYSDSMFFYFQLCLSSPYIFLRTRSVCLDRFHTQNINSRCSEASSRTRSHILQKVPCPVGKGFQCRSEYWICLCIRNVTWIVGETSLSEYMVACVCGFCVAFVYYISRDIWAWWRGMKERVRRVWETWNGGQQRSSGWCRLKWSVLPVSCCPLVGAYSIYR